MEKRGWVRGAWETSPTGRRRRCYNLTPQGKKELAPIRKEWAELFRALRHLAELPHA
jgi:DNA-binding PadR family transcriptional regulator